MKRGLFTVLIIFCLMTSVFLIGCKDEPEEVPPPPGEVGSDQPTGEPAADGSTDTEIQGATPDYSASRFCEEPDIDRIYLCDVYVKVEWSTPGRGASYFKRPATEVICPEVPPEQISDECMTLLGLDCFEYPCEDSDDKKAAAGSTTASGSSSSTGSPVPASGTAPAPSIAKNPQEEQAQDIASGFVQTTNDYKLYLGRDLQVVKISPAGCPGCFEVKVVYFAENTDSPLVTDRVIATLDVRSGSASLKESVRMPTISIEGGECDYQGGKSVPLADGGCSADEDEFGDIEEASVPSVCCLPKD